MATEKRLISLDEALEATHKEVFWTESEQAAVRSFLVKRPKVDAVEVVHGQWLFDSGSEQYFCSVCNEKAIHNSRDFPVYDYDWEENLRYSHTDTLYESFLTNYCPNCGAKMDGDGNG